MAAVRFGLRALIRPSAVRRDAHDGVDHYLEESAAAHMANGLTRADAYRAARAERGSASVESQVRGYLRAE